VCSNPRFKQVQSHVWSFWLSGPESTSNILSNVSMSLRLKLERIIPTIPKSLALWDKSYANNTWYLKTCTERTAEEIWGLNQLRRGKWRCETSQTHGELVIIDLSLGASHRSRTESPILGAWTSHLYGWPTPKSWSKGMFHQIENQRF
jgi:hypothetical protein